MVAVTLHHQPLLVPLFSATMMPSYTCSKLFLVFKLSTIIEREKELSEVAKGNKYGFFRKKEILCH